MNFKKKHYFCTHCYHFATDTFAIMIASEHSASIMAHTNTNISLSIQQSVNIAVSLASKTRADLISKISAPNYYRLCRLGIITEGATTDAKNNRIAVWKLTQRAFSYPGLTQTQISVDESNTAQALVDLAKGY